MQKWIWDMWLLISSWCKRMCFLRKLLLNSQGLEQRWPINTCYYESTFFLKVKWASISLLLARKIKLCILTSYFLNYLLDLKSNFFSLLFFCFILTSLVLFLIIIISWLIFLKLIIKLSTKKLQRRTH